jgi:hypothetical protein
MNEKPVPTIGERLAAEMTTWRSAPLLPWKYPKWENWQNYEPSTLAQLRLTSRHVGERRFVQVPEPWVAETRGFIINRLGEA